MEQILSIFPSARLVAAVFVAGLVVYKFKSRQTSQEHDLPPGPKLDPFIGHLRFVPKDYQWETFAEWGAKWGDVVYSSLFGKPIVILNSIEATRDLLDKRGAIYSDRPRQVVWVEMLQWGDMISFLHYGEKWRRHRRIMQQAFNSQSVKAFSNMQTDQVRTFLMNLLATPDEFLGVIDRFSSSIIVKATYGHDILSKDDPLVSLAVEAAGLSVAEGVPGGTIFDFLPALSSIPSWFPGAAFKKRWRYIAQRVRAMVEEPYELVESRRREGTFTTEYSFLGNLLDRLEAKDEGKTSAERETYLDDLKNVAAVMYAAGVETTERL